MEPATLGPVDVGDVVRRVIREHKLAALARIVSFETDLAPAVVVADGERLRTIVDNLVSNAIKYSPRSGTVRIALRTEKDMAVLDVTDQGPGVADDERQRIFDSFYQGREKPEGRVKGSGLGLAIAREYTMAHGGRIEVIDRPDRARGACFRLRLPLAAGVAQEASRTRSSATVRAGRVE
jgi:two-component system sensor histidine kinase GlrK